MFSIDLDRWTDRPNRQPKGSKAWDCTICGRPRLCPYGAPCSSDAREACRSCGDLLAHIGNTTTRNVASNLEVW